jgi:A/G-specific adenine glycosylase
LKANRRQEIPEDQEKQLRNFFVQWYINHGRAFPWREPKTTPFGILIVEILLRQTKAEMVVPVWRDLLHRYPTPQSAADAPHDDLYKLISPLGLGWQRVEAIKSCCLVISREYMEEIPQSVEVLMTLPHLGVYSSHAIACFAFGQRLPVVDINVLRILGRLTGQSFGVDNRRAQAAWETAWRILPDHKVQEHNYGLLDFAAKICTARKPKHEQCGLSDICSWIRELGDGAKYSYPDNQVVRH